MHREQKDKQNVWVAWLNLEAQHGETPGEAVMALFKRALPMCDAKQLYMALLTTLDTAGLVRSQAFGQPWTLALMVLHVRCCCAGVAVTQLTQKLTPQHPDAAQSAACSCLLLAPS